jgi:hypothetical protein
VYCKNEVVWKMEATLIWHWDSNWRFIVCIPTKYYVGDQIRVCGMLEEGIKPHKALVGKLQGKRLLAALRYR